MTRYASASMTAPSCKPEATAELAQAPRPDETDLVARCRRGNPGAFRELVERHHARVFRLCSARLGDAGAAEETAQDVFVRVHRSLKDFRGDAALATWIFRIAVNLCSDRARRTGRASRVPLVELQSLRGSRDEASREPGPFEGALSREESSRLRAGLAALRPELREAIELRYFADLSYTEIAAAMGCEVGTVSSRLSRALAQLGERLRSLDQAAEEDPLAP